MASPEENTRPATFHEGVEREIRRECRRWVELEKKSKNCQTSIRELLLRAEEAKDSGMIAGWIAEARLNARRRQCRSFEAKMLAIDSSIDYLREANNQYEDLVKREWVSFHTNNTVCKLMHYYYVKETGKNATRSSCFFGDGRCEIATPKGWEAKRNSGSHY